MDIYLRHFVWRNVIELLQQGKTASLLQKVAEMAVVHRINHGLRFKMSLQLVSFIEFEDINMDVFII